METRTRQTPRVRPWISICSFGVEKVVCGLAGAGGSGGGIMFMMET